jgi:aminopeptidase N
MFDFIIVHESAHEWWGNSVTSNDIADMWIHESFAAYAEALYVECRFGYDQAMSYVNGKKAHVRNDRPIIGPRDVNTPGSGDMYDKGQLVLNTLRHVIGNDSLWWEILRSINQRFKYRCVDAEDIFRLVNEKTSADYDYFFDQYLKHPKPPKLDLAITQKGATIDLRYRWIADVDSFRMPIKIFGKGGNPILLHPTPTWQTLRLEDVNPEDLRVAEDQFYVDVKRTITYLDPHKPD